MKSCRSTADAGQKITNSTMVEDSTVNRTEKLRPASTKRRSANEEGIEEPVTKKIAHKSVGREASLKTKSNKEIDTQSKNEDSHPESSIADEVCYFDRLPQEIKDIIFSKLVYWFTEDYNPNYRLVCKSWYYTCSRNKCITFSDDESVRRRAAYLANCSYEQLHLQFEWDSYDEVTNLNHIPMTVWEKIGIKIHSLQFSHCILGDQVMRSVILYCDNLKYLDVSLKTGNVAQSFCSVNLLKGLNVIRPKLETLEMHTIVQDDPWVVPRIRSEIGKWNRIFANIIRIFPNITRFIFGHNGNSLRRHYDNRPSFELRFSKDVGEVDESNLISILVHSLSGNAKKWTNALNALAKIRLTDITLVFERLRYSQEDKAAILNLFSNQKKLRLVSMRLLELKSNTDKEMLKSVFLAIINNCPELRQLGYYSNLYDWMNNDLSLLFDPSNLDEFRTGSIILEDSKRLTYDADWFDQSLIDWIPKYSFILHLTITGSVPDDFLQSIFQHMISLKSLKIYLDEKNSDFALTGRRDGIQATSSGYSINRLQNLEKLEIEWITYVQSERIVIAPKGMLSKMNQNELVGISDTAFYEFDFPKLRHLKCFLPKESSTYSEMALKMPSLTSIQFERTSIISFDSMVNFVRLVKKLHTLRLPKCDFQPDEVNEIFNACPSLRYLYTELHVDFYEPLTKKVVRHVLPKSELFFKN